MIAVISGASGLVGSVLLKKLLEDKEYSQVISLVRRPTGVTSTKLREVVLADFSKMQEIQEDLRGTTYFCCLGTTMKVAGSKANFKKVDYDAVMKFGEIAKHHQAQNFVLISAKGANVDSPFFYNQVKGEVERDLKRLNLNRLVIMHPGLLMGERSEFRLAEKALSSIVDGLDPLLPKKLSRSFVTQASELAQRMVSESKSIYPEGLTIEAQDI